VLFLQPPHEVFRPRQPVPEELMQRLRRDRAVRDALKGKGRILEIAPVRLEPFAMPPLDPKAPSPLG
jgi:hypothetical protein